MPALRLIVLIAVGLVLSCESGSQPEPPGRRSNRLLVPGATPVPCRSLKANAWKPPESPEDARLPFDGSTVDLLAADAMAQCAAGQRGSNGTILPNKVDHDSYLRRVQKMMSDAAAGAPGGVGNDDRSTEQRWVDLRTRPEYNCDPVTKENLRSVPLSLNAGVTEAFPPGDVGGIEDFKVVALAANADLRTAGMNLCIAQYLRRASPGASAGEALLLDESQQRWLLEVIRERSQIAMLHYALLGTVFALKPTSPLNTLKPAQTIAALTLWAEQCTTHSVPGCAAGNHLHSMGLDFAAAVQLHVMVTEELAQLLARSSSARIARGGAPASRADDVWGEGSWKHRMHALLFGGDPLAIEADGPWKHPLGSTTPSGWYAETWPNQAQLPHFRTEVAEPQVRELRALAERYYRLRLERSTVSCYDYDIEASAQLIFDSVEAQLRADTCAVLTATGECEADLTKLTPTASTPLSEMVLWQRHRITRDHAKTLAAHVAELLAFGGEGYTCAGPKAEPADARLGPLNVVGEVFPFGLPVYVAPGTTFTEPPLRDRAPKFTRFGSLRMPNPDEVVQLADSGKQGFHGCGSADCVAGLSQSTEAKRLMGAMSALAAVRRSVIGSLTFLKQAPASSAQTARLGDFFAQSDKILTLISGAVGEEGFSLRPWVVQTSTTPPGLAFLTFPVTINGASQLRSIWNIEGSIEQGDDFWQDGVDNYICAIEDAHAGNLAAEPTSKIFGKTIESLALAALENLTCGLARRDTASVDAMHKGPSRWQGAVPTRGPNQDLSAAKVRPTFVAVRESPRQYRLLGSQFSAIAHLSNVRQGQYLATGGALGAFAIEQSVHAELNPTEPRHDAFGFRTDWVPPQSATLVGGQPGQASTAVFLDLAKTSAAEATSAVEKAVDGLIEMEHDEVAEAAAAAQSFAGIQEEKQALCGTSDTCNVSVKTRKLSASWYANKPSAPIGPCPINPQNTADAGKAIDCIVYDVFDALVNMQAPIAKPVEDQILAPAAPSFQEFSGGSLQAAFIKQWGALRAPDEKLKALIAASKSVKAQMDVAEAVLKSVKNQIKNSCGVVGAVKGFVSGLSVGFSKSGVGVSWSPGALIAQMDKCDQLKEQLAVEKKKVIAAQQEALASMASAVQGAVDAQVAIQLSGAEIQGLVNQAKLRTARHELEARLASHTAKTSFGLARRYRAYDLWRAKALVENSRRYALAARRSIEARNVVNLSSLSKPEAFVDSPSAWADELYAYDLSLPASVGLATGEKEPGGIYSNKVKDYVTNLEAFVSGYAVSRPAAMAKDEIDVVSLPGLSSDSPLHVDPQTGQPCAPEDAGCVVRYADRGNWLVHCKGSDKWRELDPAQPASAACGKDCAACGCAPACDATCLSACDSTVMDRADLARLEFMLDPWGRVNRGVSTEPYQKRFNGRWGPLAVNVVGTGVKDCKLAADPMACYSQGFIPFNLIHVGPAWVTDYDEIWRLQGVPSGRIEGGKALAAELWLDPLKDGWSTPYVGAVKRSELELRPLGGAYELELAVGPEVQLDRIERIQLLLGSEYWVKQN